MNERSRAYVRSAFREYYHRNEPVLPLKFDKREWGFVSFDLPGMRRHKAFLSRQEAIDYLKGEVPRHAYYSSAIYHDPAAPKMEDKKWEGAELIFDLDADHLHITTDSFEEMLSAVKKETAKLLKFLEDDFGFSEEDIEIVFSGGRGYHLHVYHPKVWKLESSERREIVDYITARGLEIEKILITEKGRPTQIVSSSSWGERLRQGFLEFMEEISEMDEDKAIKYLTHLRIKDLGVQRAKKLVEVAKDDMLMGEIKKGNIAVVKQFPAGIWRNIIEERKKVKLGEIDEPVTADVKRLIRLPGSLHGGTALKVTALEIDQFKNFDPLVDAVAFQEGEIIIDLFSESSITLMGQKHTFDPGINEVPRAVGLYLICRGLAEFRGVVG